MFDIKDFWVTLIGLQNIHFVTTIVRIGNTNMKLMKNIDCNSLLPSFNLASSRLQAALSITFVYKKKNLFSFFDFSYNFSFSQRTHGTNYL